MHLHFRMRRVLAQARERPMLTFTKQSMLCAGQDQRKLHRKVRPCSWANHRFLEFRQGSVAVCQEGLRKELDLARRSLETRRYSIRIERCMLGIACVERNANASRFGTQSFNCET